MTERVRGSTRAGLRLRMAVVLASIAGCVLPALALAEKPQPQPQPASPAALLPAEPISPVESTRVGWEPSAVAEAELAEVEATYPLLEPVTRLPDFLAVDDVLALARSVDADGLRTAIHEQLDQRSGETLRGGYLEEPPWDGPDRRTYVLWIHDHLTQVLALFDARGRLVQRRAFFRAVPRRAELVALGHGQDVDHPRQALIIEWITTPSVCCLSVRWDVYRVTDRGMLAPVVDVPKSHYDVGPGVQYAYLNHVEFEEDRLVLTRIYPEGDPDGVREPYVLPYRRERRRFVPSSATARRMLADHRDPHGFEE